MVVKCICGRFMKLIASEPGTSVSGYRWEYRCSSCNSVANLYSQSGDWDVIASGVLQTPDGQEYRFDPADWRWVAEEPAQAR